MTNTACYQVCIHTETGDETYTVYATSDYAAACNVREMTGYMAKSDADVTCLFFENDPFMADKFLSVCDVTHTPSLLRCIQTDAARRRTQA